MTNRPNDEYVSIVRAVRDRVEMEMGFGIGDTPLFDRPQSAKDAELGPDASPEERAKALEKVEAEALVPELRLVTGRLPVTSAAKSTWLRVISCPEMVK